jgi:hypothetical protein
MARGLPPYATWSKARTGGDDLGRSSFPIGDTAHKYRPPVPAPGDSLMWLTEALVVGRSHALLAFAAYCDRSVTSSRSPSAAFLWLRTFIHDPAGARAHVELPSSLSAGLARLVPPDAQFILTGANDG